MASKGAFCAFRCVYIIRIASMLIIGIGHPYAIKTQRKAITTPGILELCLYGIRELASAIPRSEEWTQSSQYYYVKLCGGFLHQIEVTQ